MNQIQHTIDLFEHLCRRIPPFVPDDVQEDMSTALEQLHGDIHLTLEEVEDTMIHFAKQLWPFREAFLEFYRVNESDLGEKFLLQKMPYEMKKKYQDFIHTGGTYADLKSGSVVAMLFSSEQRGQLCEMLIAVDHELWDYTEQYILSTGQERYLERVEEFREILKDIEKELDHMRRMAEEEQEHPSLATDIRAQVRGFEERLALMGPKFDYEEVCQVRDYIGERKANKRLMGHRT